MELLNEFKRETAALVAGLSALWGWLGWLILTWIAAMTLDYITGTAAAVKAGEWSSKAAREGLWHKTGAVTAVLAAGLLDAVIDGLLETLPGNALPFDYTILLCPLVCGFYIVTEAGSILENAGKLGAPIPAWLTRRIAVLRDSIDRAGDGQEETHE